MPHSVRNLSLLGPHRLIQKDCSKTQTLCFIQPSCPDIDQNSTGCWSYNAKCYASIVPVTYPSTRVSTALALEKSPLAGTCSLVLLCAVRGIGFFSPLGTIVNQVNVTFTAATTNATDKLLNAQLSSTTGLIKPYPQDIRSNFLMFKPQRTGRSRRVSSTQLKPGVTRAVFYPSAPSLALEVLSLSIRYRSKEKRNRS